MPTPDMHVRRAGTEDRDALLAIWERSVRATHHFLLESDVVGLRPVVARELASDSIEWWVLSIGGTPIGFLGFASNTIEALFIDPDHHHQGGGRLLVAHAERLADGPLAVDVNEQNEPALRFYEALGFSVKGRSATDSGGRPFPILHMKRNPPDAREPGPARPSQG